MKAAAQKTFDGKSGEFGTYWRHQHDDGIVVEETMQAGVSRARVTQTRLIDTFLVKGYLHDDERIAKKLHAAGTVLRDDFDGALLQPRTTMRFAVSTGGAPTGADEIEARRLQHYRDWQKALKAVGPIASDELVEFCCMDKSVGEYRMLLVRRGLRMLADHYKILPF